MAKLSEINKFKSKEKIIKFNVKNKWFEYLGFKSAERNAVNETLSLKINGLE